MYIIANSAKDFLNQHFSLDATGTEEDWDIELSDELRTDEFLSYLETTDLEEDVRFALMALILASFEEMVDLKLNYTGIWNRIKAELVFRKPLYDDLVKFYQTDEQDVSFFPIAPLMREL